MKTPEEMTNSELKEFYKSICFLIDDYSAMRATYKLTLIAIRRVVDKSRDLPNLESPIFVCVKSKELEQ